MAGNITMQSLGWEWDEENGGYKPPKADSGRYSFIGNSITDLRPEPDTPNGGGSSGGSNGSTTPSSSVASVTTSAVKVATPDIVIQDSATTPIELMQELLLEDIGGQELITIARHDNLIGSPVSYHPIKNIGEVTLQYNSENMIFMPDTFKNYFKNFSIVLNNSVFEVDDNDLSPNIYNDLDSQSQNFGNIVLEFKNVTSNQQVEVQILKSGTIFDDTIYSGVGP